MILVKSLLWTTFYILMIYLGLVIIYIFILVLGDPAGNSFAGGIHSAIEFLMSKVLSLPFSIIDSDYPFFWYVKDISTGFVLIMTVINALIQAALVVVIKSLVFKKKIKETSKE